MENEFEKNGTEDLTGSVPEPEQTENAASAEEETARSAEEIAEKVHEEISEEIPEAIEEQTGSGPEKETFTPPYFNNLHYTPRESSSPAFGTQEGQPTPPYPGVQSAAAGGYGRPVPPQGQGFSGEAPRPYGVPDVNGGRISYAPEQVRKQKEKKEKKSGGKGWIAIVAAVCVLLSFGAGFLGAYVAGLTGNVKAAQADTPAESTVIRQVEPSDVSDNDPSAGSGVYADVVGAVADSVVEVYTEYTTTGWFRYIVSGGGSGVIISEDGYIVTNNHVVMADDDVTPAESVKVRTRSGEEYPATIIGGDADADIAVIKIEATGLSYATFGDSDKLAVGDEVLAIGNPLGELGGTVTNGIISALAREISVEGNDMTLLQTNTAINPGNSGGGLFNLKGELIGITNAVSDASVEGISFAIPGNEALAMAKQIMEKGPTSSNKTIIGVTLYNIDSSYKASEFGVNSLGVYVYEVKEGYNDDVLKVKDRILAVNGAEVASGDDVIAEIRKHEPGDKIELTLFRDGDVVKVEVTCFESNGDA
ncbi:MAG: trypsin-like peptidase domain-containing protein [Clostridia bacterium]|nr:trypsin-like peptidase domain-containing protein [Clostridia bacterium]